MDCEVGIGRCAGSGQSSPLTSWPKRINVALDAARGLEYLHEFAVPHLIHRDIKSSSMLIDAMWTAKVSDFGFSLMGPQNDESHLLLRAAGIMGYMDPEYYRSEVLTSNSDVYSFGVMLLELSSGRKAIHKNENGVPRNVVDYVVPYIIHDEIHRILDPRMPAPTPFEIEAVGYVGYLTADCVKPECRDRPTMTEVVNSLERALETCLAPPLLSRSTTRSSMATSQSSYPLLHHSCVYIYYEWRKKYNFLGEMSSFFYNNYSSNCPQSHAISHEFKLLVLVNFIKGGPMFKISETQNLNKFVFILILYALYV